MSKIATRISRINTVCIAVADPDRMLGFYEGVLGFEKRVDAPFGNGLRWVEVAPPGADTTIAFAPPPEGAPAPSGAQTGISLETADIDALHGELSEQGVDVDAEVTRFGDPVPPICWFRDPEGNTLMIVEA